MKRTSLNHAYRLVWSVVQNAFVAVAETTRARGKQSVSALVVIVVLGAVSPAPTFAQVAPDQLPTGGTIVAGRGNIAQSGSAMTVTQSSQQMIANWQSFSIGSAASVTFDQPNAAAVALNRVTGTSASIIEGALRANGQVFLLNPNGVLFGNGARVDVGGLVASSLQMANEDFLAGRYRFTAGPLAGAVVNAGSIHAPGGVVALIAPEVRNTGTIIADGGTAVLAAGKTVTLDFVGDGLVQLKVDEAAVNALADNRGLIRADGGLVMMSTQAADDLMSNVVNNEGILQAQTVENRAGRILLLAGMAEGETRVSGTLDASAPNGGDGGFIETSAANVQIAPDVVVTTHAEHGKTGRWLIDPTDFAISSGTAAQSGSGIGASTLQNNLGSTSVEIQTVAAGVDTGHIKVNADVAWSANTLTLTAHGNVVINATMTASGSAGLALNHGWNGDTGSPTYGNSGSNLLVHGRVDLANTSASSVLINGLSHSILRSQAEVAGIGSGLSGRYVLGSNLTFSGNWTPFGTFMGAFDGLGNTISNLTINNSLANQGLFGAATGAMLSNIRLKDVNITASNVIGALVGNANNTKITNVHASGSVTSNRAANSAADAGGLVGDLNTGSVISYSSADVAMTTNGRDVGGLVGYMRSATIDHSFATGNVSIIAGTDGEAGGLIGGFQGGATATVSNSYATGNVSAVGNSSSYTGVGGLIGGIRIDAAGVTVQNSYASGTVSTSGTNNGALIGLTNTATVTNSAGGVTASDLKGVTFGTDWVVLSGYTTPHLKAKNSDGFMLNRNFSIEQVPTLTLAQDLNTVSVLGSATLTLKSQGDIVLVTGRVIRSLGGKLNTVLWADADGNDVGGVAFDTGSGVTTNGGHLWIGGGSGQTSWNGLTVGNAYAANLTTAIGGVTQTYAGINAIGTALNAGTGDLYLSGKSFQTDYRFGVGTRFNGSTTLTANNLTIYGIGSANANTAGDTNRGNWGVGIENTTITASGNVVINGQGGGQSAGANGGQNHGVRMDANSTITANGSGNITLIGTGGGNSANSANTDNDGLRLDGGTIDAGSGTITLQGSAGLHGSSEGISHAAGAVLQTTGNISMTSTGATSTLGRITANTLNLLGAGVDYSLTHASNNISRLEGNTGSINYVDTSALAVGAITATGTVLVASLVGDITLEGTVTTGSTSADAVTINAGRAAAAGTESGGNLVVSGGSVIVGAGGTAKLYSGSVAGSTGLSALVGASNLRYNSDETDAANAALGAGLYAIYRGPAPVVTTTTTSTTQTTPVADQVVQQGLTPTPASSPPPTSNVLTPTAGSTTIGQAGSISLVVDNTLPGGAASVPSPAPTPAGLTPASAPTPAPAVSTPLPTPLTPQPTPSGTPTTTSSLNAPLALTTPSAPTTTSLPAATPEPVAPSMPASTPASQQALSFLASGESGSTPMFSSEGAFLPGVAPGSDSKAFAEAFTVALAQGISIEAALQQASAAGSLLGGLAQAGNALPQTALASPDSSGRFDSLSPEARQSLGSMLATGMDVATAMQAAQSLDAMMQVASRRDANNPAAMLASGNSLDALGLSPAAGQAFGSLLAQGVPLAQALSQAGMAGAEAAAAVARDRSNPQAGLASGDLSALGDFADNGAFAKSLAVALNRGVPPAQAIALARRLDQVEQGQIAADARSPLAAFSNGTRIPEAGTPAFDRALAIAVQRGESPAQALASARRAEAAVPADRQNVGTALASGRNADELLTSSGNSRAYRQALGKALERGLPIAQAQQVAARAELASVLRVPLPGKVAALFSASTRNLTVRTEKGEALPSWLKFDVETKTFLAFDVPPGGLPIRVVVSVDGRRATVEIAEAAAGPQ
ncbi:MAG: filamentous hemagglutinin N-terminal domain-containing protein [Rhodocyclaceae bacterium]|nr:filamentous hemagglutinin N-terminal domain-containing protein [Rhodocyclaceae bacterium]MDZ4214625.1 filamentous hemagglutinin N-terminal domain-containing protein [Rhodocyclaceae bacterium]